MHVMVIGAAGMIGRKLTDRLFRDGRIGSRDIDALTLVDVVAPERPTGFSGSIATVTADLSAPEAAAELVALRPDTVFHLAAIVSGEAEADFAKGYRINLDGTRALLEAMRLAPQPYRPRLVFASSIAVFGTPFPDRIGDEFHLAPLTSYGTQKAMCELLLADYSRRGFVDGIGLRLPTICVRPGAPNRAASGFFSNILREPLVGLGAVLPVSTDVRHWFASPRAAVGFLQHAATLELAALGPLRTLSMPGLSATVADEIEALRRAAGERAVGLIRHEPDPLIAGIVAGWARDFDPARAVSLGFKAEASMDDILRVHIEDELGGQIGG